VNLFQDLPGPNSDIVGAGQKSGVYWAFDPIDGHILWHSPQIGPGGNNGGIEWGSAAGDGRIYVAIANNNHLSYAAGSGGSWSALDPADGHILWQTPDPNGSNTAKPNEGIDLGPVTFANGVVYAGSWARVMYALDAATGEFKWSFPTVGSINSGPAVVNGVVYWGSGYRRRGKGIGDNKLYAFSLGGK
jgi:polyvinyl alcohol dehydrogenase (cytochrome)